jgi:hypothetical protein
VGEFIPPTDVDSELLTESGERDNWLATQVLELHDGRRSEGPDRGRCRRELTKHDSADVGTVNAASMGPLRLVHESTCGQKRGRRVTTEVDDWNASEHLGQEVKVR